MKIFVTKQIPGEHLEKLKNVGYEVLVVEPLEKIKDSDALLTLLTDRVDGDLMDAAGPGLKVISNYAVGYDNIDIKAASDRGIVVANTPCDEVNEAVAEHTWALILALARKIVESDEFIRDRGYFAGKGGYKGWEPDLFLGTNLIGKTLGIVGLGRIGTMVARRAQGYNMRLLYFKHTDDASVLNTLLSESDL
ncbi:MAG: NAD(P)-dependent oxidoreductase [Patescibacteria group bacterium]